MSDIAEQCCVDLSKIGCVWFGRISDAIDVIDKYLDTARNEAKNMQVHNLKTWPESFLQIWNGDKRCDFRKNDRDYRRGDELVLAEWDNTIERHTGRSMKVKITCIEFGPKFGVPEDHCVMSFSEPYDRKSP